jgi:hypothetical protein
MRVAHPEGELKEKMRANIKESFGKDPDRERKARHDLYPYLTASPLARKIPA